MFKIMSKKISLITIPTLTASLLVGCNQTEVKPSYSEIESSSSEVESSYSETFKNQFLYMANTFNEEEGFTDIYHPIQWDDVQKAPHLSENLTITSLSETEIETEFVKKLSDLEFEIAALDKKLYEHESMEEEEYKQLHTQYVELVQQYYEEVYEDLEVDEETVTKTDNTTAINQCLFYAMMGEENNEDAITLMKEGFSAIGLITSLMQIGMPDSEYIDFLLNNIYLVDDEENIYGKLSYNIKLNHDKKALVQTMKFVKYYEGMEQEMKEFEKKLEELKKEEE